MRNEELRSLAALGMTELLACHLERSERTTSTSSTTQPLQQLIGSPILYVSEF
jgi:hypothetical protein